MIIQAAVIYGHAFIAKLSVAEWMNGTSIWYWIQHPTFRPPELIADVLAGISSTWIGTVGLNYGTLALEAALMVGALLPRRLCMVLVLLGVIFHLGIAVTFGLVSFLCSMSAVLILGYVLPHLIRLALFASDSVESDVVTE